jgi:hypothetical protein
MAKKRTEEQRQHLRELVAALRSGEYEQGLGALQPKRGSYCCLGVACEISGQGAWEEGNFVDHYLAYRTKYESSSGFLPRGVMGFYGLSGQGALAKRVQLEQGHGVLSLYEANDQGASFDEIADIIEREFLGEGE